MLKQLAVSEQQPAKRKRRARRRRARGTTGEDGIIHLQRVEICASVVLKANSSTGTGNFDIVPDSFAFLKSLSRSFERLRWNTLEFYYKPAVGTTWGGLVSMGVDWDSKGEDWTRLKISSLTPNQSCAAWSDTQTRPLRLASSRIQGRLWYTPHTGDAVDKGPGRVAWAIDGTQSTSQTTVGEIWARYSVTLAGTSPS